jgi:hypothetical protein
MRSFLSLAVLTGVLASRALAQPIVPAALTPPDKDTPGASARLLEDVRLQVSRGRAQFESNQVSSVETLRDAAQKSLNALVSYVGPQVVTASPEQMPTTGFWAAAARQAAEAHYWWGRAADGFGRRDEAVTAFARAARFAGQLRGGSNALARDSLLALGGSLRDGLPLIAPDDTLDTIADIAHGKLWEPRRFSVDYSNLNFVVAAANDPASGRRAPLVREFLITAGRLYPPVPSSAVDVASSLSRIPPLYRRVKEDALPDVLKLDRMAVGYERAAGGPDKGLWRQAVRVFYASSYLTKDRRDDSARSQMLCAQFLKTRALFQTALGLENSFAKDGVTTLWLSEVSSLWPRDDDDPQVRAALGSQMPKINVRTIGQSAITEIDTPPTSFPWRAAGQLDSSPGEIMFFKMTAARDESEWLREIMHEYGHVALPSFDNFRPPLEPYSNGLLGETLGMLWAAGDPASWGVPAEASTPATSNAGLPAAVRAHVHDQARAALAFWLDKGPVSTLRRDPDAPGLQYLQGLAVYIERVYGAPVLAQALSPLAGKGVNAANPLDRLNALNTESLLAGFPNALRDAFGSSISGTEIRVVVGGDRGVLPVWLGGALEVPKQTTDDLISRAPLKLAAGARATGWLYVPPSASTLRVEWQGANRSADTLTLEGAKTTPLAPLHPDAASAFKLDVNARPGWQKFTFLARSEVTILAAQFEK